MSGTDERALGAIPTENMAAYDVYVSGRANLEGISSEQYAAALASDLLEVNDRDWRTLAMLAFCQSALGRSEDADENMARALQLSEGNAETLYYAGIDAVAAG